MDQTYTCDECKHWKGPDEHGRGECRRYAPRPSRRMERMPAWPLTVAQDWCGEFATVYEAGEQGRR